MLLVPSMDWKQRIIASWRTVRQ